jgi:hypothetical protein
VSNFSNTSGTYGKLHVRYNNASLTTDAVNIDHNGDYVETFECTATNLIMRFIANLSLSTGATSFKISNLMIRPASITDSTYEPYAKTNRELTVISDEIHGLMDSITSSTTMSAYTDSLEQGHYVTFISSTSTPSDAPVADRMFVEIFVYSSYTALIRAYPTGPSHAVYQKTKVEGLWGDWYKFIGTAVT